jgi:diguanylate cyclase (GGDEF)-like protein/PAS domain S-box-containing protein
MGVSTMVSEMKKNIKIDIQKGPRRPHLEKVPPGKAAGDDRENSPHKTILSKLEALFKSQRITYKLLKQSEEQYRSFFENSLDGMYKSTPDGKYIDANQALVKMLGYDSKEELLSIDSPGKVYASKKYQPSPDKRDKLHEIQFKKKDGTLIWVEASSRLIYDKEKPVCYEGTVREITERKKREEKIIYLSFHDLLTGLYNRAYFEEEIKRLNTKRQLPLSLIIADINNLKVVNDGFGHLEGDRLIVKVAELLKAFCRKEDVIARWGGDEFTILLPKTSKEDAGEIANRIKKVSVSTSKQEIPLSISLGLATKEEVDGDFQDVIKEAEDNMYRHKLIERKSIYSSITSSLERTLYEKSLETREHAERLKELSHEVGEAINLPGNIIDELSLLSTLHDIGKIAIPEKILTNGRKLTEKEWALVKKHPEIGYNISRSNPQLIHIAEGVLSHHEWWNGEGYPNGLRGADIPVTSRIISIVDAYDVMISGRTYKKAITKEEAIEELKRCSGTQFDPELTDIFINIVLAAEKAEKRCVKKPA